MISATSSSSFLGCGSILIVGSISEYTSQLLTVLQRDGFGVRHVLRTTDAIDALRGEWLDALVIIGDGADASTLAACRLVRHEPEVSRMPIVVVGPAISTGEVVRVLRAGADVYATMCDDVDLLLARIKTVLRRCSWAEAEADVDFDRQDRVLRVGEIMIRPARFSVHVGSEQVDLTVSEFRILMLLASKPGRVFTRDQVFATLHQHDVDVSDRSIDSHLYTLRRKLGVSGNAIQTVRGVGYRIVNAPDQEQGG